MKNSKFENSKLIFCDYAFVSFTQLGFLCIRVCMEGGLATVFLISKTPRNTASISSENHHYRQPLKYYEAKGKGRRIVRMGVVLRPTGASHA